jgi:hypothetical protein
MVGGCAAFWGVMIVGRRIGKLFKGENPDDQIIPNYAHILIGDEKVDEIMKQSVKKPL